MTEEKYSLVLDLVNSFTALYPESEFRFGHIVLSDYNLSNKNIEFCIQAGQSAEWQSRRTDDDEPTLQFLNLLKMLPEAWREEPPESYP